MSRTPLLITLAIVAALALAGALWLAGGPDRPERADPVATAPAADSPAEAARLPVLPAASSPDRPATALPSAVAERGVATLDTSGAPTLVEGRVVTRAGRPVEGAQLELFELGGTRLIPERWDLSLPALSDVEGRFRISGIPPATELGLAVQHATHAPLNVEPFRVPPGDLLILPDIVLSEGLALRGAVRDEHGQPLAGASAELTDITRLGTKGAATTAPRIDQGLDGDADRTVVTDSTGAYVFEHLGQRQYRVTARATGHGQASIVMSLVLGAPTQGWTQDFILPRADSRVALLLLDGPGRPLPEASVVISQRTRRNNTYLMRSGLTDAQGRAVFDELPEGLYEVELVSTSHYLDRPAHVAAGSEEHLVRALSTQAVQLRLQTDDGSTPPGSFRLTIRPDGRTGAGLAGGGNYVREVLAVDPPGQTVIGSLRPGSYRFEVQAPGFAPTASSDVILGSEVGRPADVLIILSRGGTIAGRLAEPQPNVAVELREEDFDPAQPLEAAFPTPPAHGLVTRTGVHGSFRIEHVPAGRWVLSVRPAAGPPLHLRDVETVNGRTTELAPIHLARGGTIFGNVVGPDGEPRAGTRITAVGPDHQAQALSDAAGAFRMESLPSGPYELQAVPGGLWEALRLGAEGSVHVVPDEEHGVLLQLVERPRNPPR